MKKEPKEARENYRKSGKKRKKETKQNRNKE